MTTSADTSSATHHIYVDLDHDRLSIRPDFIEACVRNVLVGEDVLRAEVGIVLGNRALVRALNRRYLEHDQATDVLSFPLSGDGDVLQGEVYVDLDTAEERCAEFGTSFVMEAARYVVHGILHLVGYSDETDEQRDAMRELEDKYLEKMPPGIAG